MVILKVWSIFITNLIEICINTKSPNKTIKYLRNLNINIYNIKYQEDSITIKINLNDLDKVGKYYNYEIIRYYGKTNILNYLKLNKLSFIFLFTIILFIFIITRFIISINVITEDSNLQSTLLNELDKNNIYKYSLVKDANKLNKIKEIILNNNKDKIEWLNIERKGMKYFINVEPKVDKNKVEEKPYCHIISLKDSMVTRIITSKGMEVVDVNDSVKKGDILISGDIKFNEETKNQVCASGKVYGRTWYTVNITIPRNYEKITKLNKKRYNIKISFNNKHYRLFKNRLSNYITESQDIVNILGFKISLDKDIEVKSNTQEYSDQELELNIKKQIENKMKNILNGEYQIITQKVLKKELNDSKIDMEVFIVAEEEIGTTIEGNLNTTENNE